MSLQQERMDMVRQASDQAARERDEQERLVQEVTGAEAGAIATAERVQKTADAAMAQNTS